MPADTRPARTPTGPDGAGADPGPRGGGPGQGRSGMRHKGLKVIIAVAVVLIGAQAARQRSQRPDRAALPGAERVVRQLVRSGGGAAAPFGPAARARPLRGHRRPADPPRPGPRRRRGGAADVRADRGRLVHRRPDAGGARGGGDRRARRHRLRPRGVLPAGERAARRAGDRGPRRQDARAVPGHVGRGRRQGPVPGAARLRERRQRHAAAADHHVRRGFRRQALRGQPGGVHAAGRRHQ